MTQLIAEDIDHDRRNQQGIEIPREVILYNQIVMLLISGQE